MRSQRIFRVIGTPNLVSIEAVVRSLVSVGLVGPQLPPLEVTGRGLVVPTPVPIVRPLVVPRHAVIGLIIVMSSMVRTAKICSIRVFEILNARGQM